MIRIIATAALAGCIVAVAIIALIENIGPVGMVPPREGERPLAADYDCGAGHSAVSIADANGGFILCEATPER